MILDHNIFGNKGETVVILHGLLGSQRNWMSIAKALSADCRVILFDLRNHGRSPWNDNVSIKAMAGDIIESVDKLRVTGFWIVGHSLGGKVGMKVSLDNEQRVKGLTVVDIAPRQYQNLLMHDLEGMLSLDLSSFKTRRDAELALAMHVPDQTQRQFLLTNLRRDDDGSLVWATNLKALYQGMDELRAAPFRSGSRVRVPSLFLFGERSSYIEETDVALVKRTFVDPQIEWVARAGHNVHTDQPLTVLQNLQHFIQA